MGASAKQRKVLLAVIDGMSPSMLDRAIAVGRAPTLAALIERGFYSDECISAFPSITPVCAASITTGTDQDQHGIPSMNWYHRGEQRYVEYGSSVSASRRTGIIRSLTDTVYNMNLVHLARTTPTVFELLDDADIRTACTSYLIYRGRYRHEPARETALARFATAAIFRHATYGPREFFYADLFASRETGCSSQLGLPGARDAHSGCAVAFLVENDLADFALLSLPDNDTISHRSGVDAQIEGIELADKQLARVAEAAGGVDSLLEEWAVIVVSDHGHARVEQRIELADPFAGESVQAPDRIGASGKQLAVCPAQRSAMIYALDPATRTKQLGRAESILRDVSGVDLIAQKDSSGVSNVWTARGEFSFSRSGGVRDEFGRSWTVDGDLSALAIERDGNTIFSHEYPDALHRLQAALDCRGSGDLVVSAAPGREFVDWGGVDHQGAGGHGSLHRSDTIATLIGVGCGYTPEQAQKRPWAIRDVATLVRQQLLT